MEPNRRHCHPRSCHQSGASWTVSIIFPWEHCLCMNRGAMGQTSGLKDAGVFAARFSSSWPQAVPLAACRK